MKRKDLFRILLNKEGLDFESIDTRFISNNQQQFLEDILKTREECIFIQNTGKLCILQMQGIIFLAQAESWETSPEGPNNEPPGIHCIVNYQWCTQKTPLKKSTVNGLYPEDDWKKVLPEAQADLEQQKVVHYS